MQPAVALNWRMAAQSFSSSRQDSFAFNQEREAEKETHWRVNLLKNLSYFSVVSWRNRKSSIKGKWSFEAAAGKAAVFPDAKTTVSLKFGCVVANVTVAGDPRDLKICWNIAPRITPRRQLLGTNETTENPLSSLASSSLPSYVVFTFIFKENVNWHLLPIGFRLTFQASRVLGIFANKAVPFNTSSRGIE